MVRETFRKIVAKATALFSGPSSPQPPEGKFYSDAEFRKKFAPTGKLPRVNKYAPIDGHGPGAAARRVRAMVRTPGIHGSVNQAAVLVEYERHVRNGNVYK